MNAKSILQAINLLSKAPQEQVDAAIEDAKLTETVKADAMHLTAAEEVKDVYSDTHRVPSREEINVGPNEAASGAGAEKMIREYSQVAPQVGVQLDYEKLAAMFGEMAKAQKAQTEAITRQSDLLIKLTQNLAKADDEEDGEKEDKEDEAAEKARALTESHLRKADDLLTKADALNDKLEATKSSKNKKMIQGRIDDLHAQATTLLEKARKGVAFVDADDLRDTFNDIAMKADADLEGDDDKDEEKADDKEEKKAEESESDVSKAQLAIEKALNGISVMHGEVKDIYEALSNKSRSNPVSNALTKSAGPARDDNDEIFDRMSQRVLSQDETQMCDNLIQLKSLVKGGATTQRDFDAALKTAPDTVKEIFA